MMFETRKILGDESIAISVTCARVPVTYSHSESVNLQTREPLEVEEARALLEAMPGLTLVEPVPDRRRRAGHDDVFVGRLRRDPSHERGLQMWVVSDNLRKGAATNAVQLAEQLYARGLVGARAAANVNCGSGRRWVRAAVAGGVRCLTELSRRTSRIPAASRAAPLPAPLNAQLTVQPTAPTTEVDQSITLRRPDDVLGHPELLRVEPEREADELREVEHRHPEVAPDDLLAPAAAAGRG